jgi:hypothetical protein
MKENQKKPITIDTSTANKYQTNLKLTKSTGSLIDKKSTKPENKKNSKAEKVAPEPENKPLKENSSSQPSVETISAQKWLETKYPEKDSVKKIEFREKGQYKLVGKLEIKDFPRLKIIDISESEGITELIIDNCFQNGGFVEETLNELDNEKKKSTELIKLVEKALEEINRLKYCANELEGHIEYLKENEKLRLTTFFLKLKVLLGSSAEEYNCENKSSEEISDLINAKLKELEKKLSSQQQTKILNGYPQLENIQSQILSEAKNKQAATERKLNFALTTLAISVISSIGLLGAILIKMKSSEKTKDKIKK